MSFSVRPFPGRSARRLGVGIAVLVAACDATPQSVEYVAPAPGTVYDYGTFTNTVTASEGWRVRFTDNRGREGERIALFLTGDPTQPLEVHPAALDSLWPLQIGRELAFPATRGDEVWRWELRVLPGERVTVPAGSFETILVQGVQAPELVRDPSTASTVVHSWWYAPAVNTVVRYRTRYAAGAGEGRVVEGELRAITPPDSAAPAPGGAGAD